MRGVLTAIFALILAVSCGGGDGAGTRSGAAGGSGQAASGLVTAVFFAGTGETLDDGAAFDQLAAAIGGSGADFAVHLGGRLPHGAPSSGLEPLLDAADDQLAVLDIPVYPVAGPDDIFDEVSGAAYVRRYGPRWYDFEREGVHFVMLCTEDGGYATGFGARPAMSGDQLAWLGDVLDGDVRPSVVCLNRPLWEDAPDLWADDVLPLLREGHVALLVTASPDGLFDWGGVDGIPAVSTGCVGPVGRVGPGLVPHALLVTVDGGRAAVRVLHPGGNIDERITVDAAYRAQVGRLAGVFDLQPLPCAQSWAVNATVDIALENRLAATVAGSVSIDLWPGTAWRVGTGGTEFAVEPGVSVIRHLTLTGTPPDLGPLPRLRAGMVLNGVPVLAIDRPVTIAVPRPRTGEPFAVAAEVPDVIPYRFDGSGCVIPIVVDGMDVSGRLLILRPGEDGPGAEVYLSPFSEFRPGINEIIWPGVDFDGAPVPPGEYECRLIAYNKDAPVTWVADGPPDPAGTLVVERTLNGLVIRTHDTSGILTYRIGGSIREPEPSGRTDLTDILEGRPLLGFAGSEEKRLYLVTDRGVACAYSSLGTMRPDPMFGDRGYVRLDDLRGRRPGSPSYWNGILAVGTGGGNGGTPQVLLFDGVTGKRLDAFDLGFLFGEEEAPPSVTLTDRGILVAHPDAPETALIAYYGETIWMNGDGDGPGDMDVDGRSHTFHIGVDRYGMSYVNAPGTSARSGVIGFDGRGLFRVILVQLPGLRTSAAIPMIEGETTDGLYLVTEGGDRPYVFHVPYTVRSGRIVTAGPPGDEGP